MSSLHDCIDPVIFGVVHDTSSCKIVKPSDSQEIYPCEPQIMDKFKKIISIIDPIIESSRSDSRYYSPDEKNKNSPLYLTRK
jgi:hypothetical protein